MYVNGNQNKKKEFWYMRLVELGNYLSTAKFHDDFYHE